MMTYLNVYDCSETVLPKVDTQNNDGTKQEKDTSPRLRNLLLSDGPINVDDVKDILFPAKFSYDFFISHSHKDEILAKDIYDFLLSRGYTVFLDSKCWGNIDDLANELNKSHLHSENGMELYDHQKTMMVQKNCDVILETALTEAMNRSSIILFINTPSSLNSAKAELGKTSSDDWTSSPWIFHELFILPFLQKDNSIRRALLEHSGEQFKYVTKIKEFPRISLESLIRNAGWRGHDDFIGMLITIKPNTDGMQTLND